MKNDFLISSLFGLIILFLFWIIVIAFIYIRKPPNSKLTLRLIISSFLIFSIIFIIIIFLL